MLQPKTSQSTLTVLARNVLSNLASPEQLTRPVTHEHSQDMKLWTLKILRLSPLPTCPIRLIKPLYGLRRLICQQCKNVSFLNPVKHLFLLDPIFRPQLSSWPQLSCYKSPNSHQQECTLKSQHPTILHSQQFHVRKSQITTSYKLQSQQSHVRKIKDTQLKKKKKI